MSIQANIEKAEQKPQPPVQTTLIIPFALWRAVKNRATDLRTSQTSLWIAAMHTYLKQKNGEKS